MGPPLNQIDVTELANDVEQLKRDPAKCHRTRKLRAEWVGGTRAIVHNAERQLHIGGDADFGGDMSVTLAGFLACEVDVIATHATLRGIELENLTIEGTGDFNIARYMGVGQEPSPGYQKIQYTFRIRAKNATPEQLRDLVKLCETASPVGDTLERNVELTLKTEVE
jgi:uncharacterized OsmC-like protein